MTVALTRPATPGDIDTLVGLMAEFHAESGYALDREAAALSFRRLLSNPGFGGAWLAMVGGHAGGYVALTQRYCMDHGAFTGHIEDLYVRPSCRRGGVASTLLSALLEDCRLRECRSIQVEVGDDNTAAIALYRKFGLGPHGDGRLLLHGPLNENEEST